MKQHSLLAFAAFSSLVVSGGCGKATPPLVVRKLPAFVRVANYTDKEFWVKVGGDAPFRVMPEEISVFAPRGPKKQKVDFQVDKKSVSSPDAPFETDKAYTFVLQPAGKSTTVNMLTGEVRNASGPNTEIQVVYAGATGPAVSIKCGSDKIADALSPGKMSSSVQLAGSAETVTVSDTKGKSLLELPFKPEDKTVFGVYLHWDGKKLDGQVKRNTPLLKPLANGNLQGA